MIEFIDLPDEEVVPVRRSHRLRKGEKVLGEFDCVMPACTRRGGTVHGGMCRQCRAEHTGEHVAGVKRAELGSVPAAIKEEARAELCVYCGAEASGVDHLEPISSGGTNDPENFVPACWDCNAGRGASDLTAWDREKVLRAMRVSERVRTMVWDEAHHRAQERHEEQMTVRESVAQRAAFIPGDREQLRAELTHRQRGHALVALLRLARRKGYDDVQHIVLEELTAPVRSDVPEGIEDAEDENDATAG